MPEEEIFLTREAYDEMQRELSHRQGELRNEIAKRISDARAEGDLSENGGYQAAKEEQAKNEGRINELTVKLRSAKILSVPSEKNKKVREGCVVKLKVGGRESEFLIGSHELSCVVTDKQIISPKSPIGQAILNHEAGEKIRYKAPGGREMDAEVLEVSPLGS